MQMRLVRSTVLQIAASMVFGGAVAEAQTTWTGENRPTTADNVISISRGILREAPTTYAVSGRGNYLMRAMQADLSDWTLVYDATPIIGGELVVVACAEQAAEIVYIGVKNSGVYKSTDAGDNWSWVSTGLGYTNFSRMKVSPHDGNRVLAGMHVGAGQYPVLWQTTDGGANWSENVAFQEVRITITKIVFHPVASEVIYLLGKDEGSEETVVWRSENGGLSWIRSVANVGDLGIDEMLSGF